MNAAAVPAPPQAAQMDRLAGLVAPMTAVTAPRVFGLDRLPGRGALFVGNHTLFGFLDLPFMMSELWKRRGIALRGLGEHGHYAVPVWRDLLEMCGMVRGTRDNVRALMDQGESILVFPGGAGEVFKKRGQRYQLLWKERLGFARLAIEHGYPIVPFAAVGAEEMYDIVADDQTPGYREVSGLMKRLVGVSLPPLPRGLGPTLLPRPQRLYFKFAEPIDTTRFADQDQDRGARALRDEVRAAVETNIADLQRLRDTDSRRPLASKGQLPQPAPDQTDADALFVRRGLEAWNEMGPAGAAAWLSRSVVLTDPPEWPGATTWQGRDLVLSRLEQVSNDLGGGHADLISVDSTSEGVTAVLEVREAGDGSRSLGRFRLTARLEDEQIASLTAGIEELPAGVAPASTSSRPRSTA